MPQRPERAESYCDPRDEDRCSLEDVIVGCNDCDTVKVCYNSAGWTIAYYTIRYEISFNGRSRADISQLNLSTSRNQQLKSGKTEKLSKNGYAQKYR